MNTVTEIKEKETLDVEAGAKERMRIDLSVEPHPTPETTDMGPAGPEPLCLHGGRLSISSPTEEETAG